LQSNSSLTPSSWKEQGKWGGAAHDKFGTSVSLSADAKILVIGAPGHYGDDKKTGYVNVYQRVDRDGSYWEPLGKTIVGKAAGDRFGFSVDVCADGTVLAIGSPGPEGDEVNTTGRPGYVIVYHLDSSGDLGSSTWKPLGEAIDGEADGDEFGVSVSLSDENKTLAVGAWFVDGENGEHSGSVKIYSMADDNPIWRLIGQIDGQSPWELSGYSLSLSADGTVIAIGNGANSDFGYVWVYRMDSGGWGTTGNPIQGDSRGDRFGCSVDISGDGVTLAIGAPGGQYVKVFHLESDGSDSLGSSSWKLLGNAITTEEIGDDFGISISLSRDGKTLVVGAPGSNGVLGDDSGNVRIYHFNDTTSNWMHVGEDIIGGEAAYDKSGISVSVSADGETVAIGSYENKDNGPDSGHVRIFSVSV
jgi:hypothetical protein